MIFSLSISLFNSEHREFEAHSQRKSVCFCWEEARFRGVRTRSVMGEKFKVCREIYFGSVAIHYKSRPQGRDTGGSKEKKEEA